MKVLICGNGNITRRDKRCFMHEEIGLFLQQCCDLGLTVGFATIILNADAEKVKNLANGEIPEGFCVEPLPSFSSLNILQKLLMLPVIILKMLCFVFKYDFFYCYYPGTVATFLIKTARIFRKRYALYVRGNLDNTESVKRDISGAAFVFATGTTIVSNICPDYPRCQEVSPMSHVFRRACASAPRTEFHNPLRGVFVGRVSREKGVYELLDALKMLKENGVPVTMNFVGAYDEGFKAEIKARNIEGCVQLSGLVSGEKNLQKHYSDADFFCLPTWTEGFPRVLYEAMSYGLPSLTTMVGGIPSRMRDGENCLALKVKDAESIVAAVTTLYRQPELMSRLSESSLKTFNYWKNRFKDVTHARQLYFELVQREREQNNI